MSAGAQVSTGPPVVASAAARHPLFEPLALALLSLATVGTAWCSFQAASWGGVAGGLSNRAASFSRKAAAAQLEASQLAVLDVMLFSLYINARAATNEPLANFYAERFRGEAKVAFEGWTASKPFENSNAPAHPSVASLYKPKLLTEVEAAETQSQELAQRSGEAGRASRGYILVTVVLACALFCGGTAPKFENLSVRRILLGIGLAAFAFALERLVLLPVQ